MTKNTISDNFRDEFNKRAGRKRIGWTLVSFGGGMAVAMIIMLMVSQCVANKELRQKNEKLTQGYKAKVKNLRQAQKTIDYVSAQRDALATELTDCRENCAPRPVAKPAPRKQPARPASPKPQPKPVPVAAPIIIRDTVRDTVVQVVSEKTEKKTTKKPYIGVRIVELSTNSACRGSNTNANGSNEVASTVAADTVVNTIVADTINNARAR